jgi:hypothetical protein
MELGSDKIKPLFDIILSDNFSINFKRFLALILMSFFGSIFGMNFMIV